MKISDKEATILASAEFRANAPIEQLRKESGYRDHTIRYALRRLHDRGIIAPVPFVNLHRLGYSVYSIFFSVDAEQKGAKQAISKALVASPEVLFVGEFGGEFQYGMAFCAKRFSTVIDFLKSLSKKHRRVFHEKAISVQISSTIFPRGYLSGKKFSVAPLTLTADKDIAEIDELDEKILSGLTNFSGLSYRQLGLKLQIPLSTLELRVKKLREKKVLVADIYMVDAAFFEMHSFKLLVYAKGLDEDLTKALYKFCTEHRNITYFIECLGSWSYEIGVEVPDAWMVSGITQEIYDTFSGSINTIKSLTKLRYPKARWFPG